MKYTDGKTVTVVAPAGGVAANRGYRVSGWNGVAELSADATANAVLTIDPAATFYIKVPAAFTGALGDVIYMPPAGGAAESVATATSAGNVAAFKVHEAKDANHIVGVRVLNIA
jgi:hypothetical protein